LSNDDGIYSAGIGYQYGSGIDYNSGDSAGLLDYNYGYTDGIDYDSVGIDSFCTCLSHPFCSLRLEKLSNDDGIDSAGIGYQYGSGINYNSGDSAGLLDYNSGYTDGIDYDSVGIDSS
jgi:hypothetical protein